MRFKNFLSIPLLSAATFLTFTAFAEENLSNPKVTQECPKQLLTEIDSAYHRCNRAFQDESCKNFIDTFRKLSPSYDCKRSFDTEAVPAIWLAGDAAFGDFIELLVRLTNEKDPLFKEDFFASIRQDAKKFFGSEEFRSTLDGEFAEAYLEKSEKVGRELAQTKETK